MKATATSAVTPAARRAKEVASGRLKIVKAGDGSVHPIEAKYLAPEVHSLMKVDRPAVRAADLDRLVVLVNEPLHKLKAKSPWVWRYLQYGTTAEFASKKSKAVPVPERSTCTARKPWYNLTGLVKPGIAFWPMSQQYRHIIAANPEQLICNHNLFDVRAEQSREREAKALVAILNSTLVGLFKTFYGRFAGTEGNLKTEVVDVNLLGSTRSPRHSARTGQAAGRRAEEHEQTRSRPSRRGAVDGLPQSRARAPVGGGANSPFQRVAAIRPPRTGRCGSRIARRGRCPRAFDGSSTASTRPPRGIFAKSAWSKSRRCSSAAKSNGKRFSVQDLAADIWDAAELEDATPLGEWLARQPESNSLVIIPDERPVALSDDVMFSPNTVFFGKGRKTFVDCSSRGQAELVARLADLGLSGEVRLPAGLSPCFKLLDRMNRRIDAASRRFKELADSRTGDERIQDELVNLLTLWLVRGREAKALPDVPQP